MFEHGIFADPQTLALGAVTGLVFGFLLQRAHVTRADTIVGQFLLKNFTVLKVMLTAVVVGGFGVYGMLQLGMIEGLHVKSAAILGNTVGGAIFGVGMVIAGYCPGTGVAALGDGSRDAFAVVAGMLAGAAAYAEAYPWLKANLLSRMDLGKLTLPDAAGLSPWWFVAAVGAIAITAFAIIETIERRRPVVA
jgi:uncharacterized membrane protein YedE/YeeE